MATDQGTKLHYLDLLTEIAPGEQRAGVFLKAWADQTPDPELKACLDLVARRETSHYHIFKRRIEELGYTLEEQEDPDFHERLQVNGSDRPDIDKIRDGQARQKRQQQSPTRAEKIEAAMADETVDPLTRSLLRWFADVEADSGARLRQEYARIEAKVNQEA